jgi:choline dehydrogenase-like flavoprotein
MRERLRPIAPRKIGKVGMKGSYDFIIVGAGSAGCVLANKLSADPAHSVLLVESGPPDDSWLLRMPRGIGQIMGPGNPQSSYQEVSRGGNRRSDIWQKGRTLGGSSSINGMVYARGHPTDYDRWEAAGCTGWGWNNIKPIMIAMEDHELGASDMRGVGGPLRVTVQPRGNILHQAVIDAAGEAGVPPVIDTNDTPLEGGIGYQPRTVWRGERQSAARAFLEPARKRPNLDIVTNTDVLRILFEGQRATGVEIRDGAGIRSVGVHREVVLSAGALQSPKLLQLSGVGPASLLSGLGIGVVRDAPGVGRNLREHLCIWFCYRVSRGSQNREFRGWRLGRSLLRYLFLKDGPLTNAAHELIAYVRTRPGLARPDAQIGVGLYSVSVENDKLGVEKAEGMTVIGYFMHPESQGEARIQSANPDAPMAVNANYLHAEEDRRAAIALARTIRRIVGQPALKPFILEELAPSRKVETDDEILQYVYDTGTTGYHVSGTCRMGSDLDSVLDCELRVRGVDGLRVADTSIIPELVSGNTNAMAMAIGWRAAELILGQEIRR